MLRNHRKRANVLLIEVKRNAARVVKMTKILHSVSSLSWVIVDVKLLNAISCLISMLMIFNVYHVVNK